jgi:hypothetical protein
MNKDTFHEHLSSAVEKAVTFAGQHVWNRLASSLVFLVYPNESFDGNPLREDEVTYPADTQPNEAPLIFPSIDAVVGYLWRDGNVPEWIDINVAREDGKNTSLRLLCCGRFTAREELLYHRDGGIPPFSVKSPYLPPGYDAKRSARSQKFDVNWRDKS